MLKMVKKLLIALGVIFFLFCVFVLLIRVGVLELNTTDKGSKVFSIDADKLKSIDISNSSGDYTLNIDGQKVTVKGYENRPHDSTETDGVIETCRKLYAYDVIEKETSDFGIYGLDKPQMTATVSSDDEIYTVYIGDMMPNNDSYYVSIGNEKTVYAVNQEYLYYYKQNAYNYLSTSLNLLKEADTEYMIDNFSFTQKGVPILEFHAYTDKEKEFYNTNNLYTITYPYNAVAKDANIVKYLNSIVTLKCARIITTDVNDAALAESGLKDPEYFIKYTYYDKQTVIRISKPDNGISRIYVEGDDTIYSFLAQKLNLLSFDIFNLVNTNQFTRAITYVDRAIIDYNGTSYVYGLNWNNGTLTDVTINGSTIPQDTFKTFYTILTSSRIDGIPEEAAEENPYLSVTLKYNDTSGFNTDTITFHKINARQYLMKINGEGEFYVSSVYVEKIIDSMTAMNKGETITAEW